MRPTTRRPQGPAGRPASATTTDAVRPAARTGVDDAAASVAEVDQPIDDRAVARTRPGRTDSPAVGRTRTPQASSLLAARAAEEYAYVARDIRHIGVVGGGLFVILIALYIVIEVLGVVHL
jgi:hypothetical protein